MNGFTKKFNHRPCRLQESGCCSTWVWCDDYL